MVDVGKYPQNAERPFSPFSNYMQTRVMYPVCNDCIDLTGENTSDEDRHYYYGDEPTSPSYVLD